MILLNYFFLVAPLFCFDDSVLCLFCDGSKRLNCVNHARRLASGDWTGADSDEEAEDMEKQKEGEQPQDGTTEEEEMEVERRKPRSYANQVQFCYGFTFIQA